VLENGAPVIFGDLLDRTVNVLNDKNQETGSCALVDGVVVTAAHVMKACDKEIGDHVKLAYKGTILQAKYMKKVGRDMAFLVPEKFSVTPKSLKATIPVAKLPIVICGYHGDTAKKNGASTGRIGQPVDQDIWNHDASTERGCSGAAVEDPRGNLSYGVHIKGFDGVGNAFEAWTEAKIQALVSLKQSKN
jgi:V8-like Glu-specific endopeptidase